MWMLVILVLTSTGTTHQTIEQYATWNDCLRMGAHLQREMDHVYPVQERNYQFVCTSRDKTS